jgi:hypothetical protein
MASGDAKDWLHLTELAGLPPPSDKLDFEFDAKHKSYAWTRPEAKDGAGPITAE